jgi:hypothetical protein
MNVYRCWYKGIAGFASRAQRNAWMFVPDLGEVDNRVRRNLLLSDLVFKYRHQYDYELNHPDCGRVSLRQYLRKRLFRSGPAHTTAGMLLLPQQR